jgi:hypothetical protein
MGGDDRDDDDRDDPGRRPGREPAADVDPDRAAILARRRRFIAIALSGLTTAACDEPASKPDACLKVKVSDPKEPKGTPPQPCLNVEVVTSDDGAADDGKGDTGGADGGKAGDESTSAAPTPCLEVMPTPCLSPPRPHPCLMVAPPRPCLDVPAPPRPTACLKVAPPPDPKPRPCLKVKRPEPEPEDIE